MARSLALTDEQFVFLGRFVARGWLHARRDDIAEQEAVEIGFRKRYLRREMSEAHFTPLGRKVLSGGEDKP